MIDRVDAHRLEVAHVVGRHLLGQGGHRHAAGFRFVDQLVVDVGDVDDQRDLIAGVDEIAFDRVEDDRPDHVADVAGFVDGRPAKIDADLARRHRLQAFPCSSTACYRLESPWPIVTRVGVAEGRWTGARASGEQIGSTIDQENDALGLDRLAAADRADLFSRFGLDADRRGFQLDQLGDPAANRFFVGRELRLLGQHDTVDVRRAIAGLRGRVASAAARISAESRPRFSAAVSGNSSPMSGSPAAPNSASVRACNSTSASL